MLVSPPLPPSRRRLTWQAAASARAHTWSQASHKNSRSGDSRIMGARVHVFPLRRSSKRHRDGSRPSIASISNTAGERALAK
ncbi:hypothetical protein M011DRAFT_351086 [Sporormia fimetaria CBS 119925]|uniref:Uncharacterized protein n=1 Tax=Sporormia fimetaria CBS 119925 TaxID=1340428 RepID=A0A6A6VD39_9PLEO|nr:hypothetical protein M011DRAFT_351086 [Sporormia fimetaria CBS 119925]